MLNKSRKMVLATILAAPACSSADAPTASTNPAAALAGAYVLLTLDGSTPPVTLGVLLGGSHGSVVLQRDEVLSDTLRLGTDLTWQESGVRRITTNEGQSNQTIELVPRIAQGRFTLLDDGRLSLDHSLAIGLPDGSNGNTLTAQLVADTLIVSGIRDSRPWPSEPHYLRRHE